MGKKSKRQFKLSREEHKEYETSLFKLCLALREYQNKQSYLSVLRKYRKIGSFVKECQDKYHNKAGMIRIIAKDLQKMYGKGKGFSIEGLKEKLRYATEDSVYYFVMGTVYTCEKLGIPFKEFISFEDAKAKSMEM